MTLFFDDYPDFTPNLKPFEIIKMGSFGGTYFRPIFSTITNQHYTNVYKELPKFWFKDIPDNYYKSSEYDKNINKYKVKCGSDLLTWETSGWINPQDPYGWFQWYCKFYCGRRTDDDIRQIKRWLNLAGPRGRIRKRFLNNVTEETYNDFSFSPAIRQTLMHWAFEFS